MIVSSRAPVINYKKTQCLHCSYIPPNFYLNWDTDEFPKSYKGYDDFIPFRWICWKCNNINYLKEETDYEYFTKLKRIGKYLEEKELRRLDSNQTS